MSVEKVIQDIWITSNILVAAVPLERLWKGILPQDAESTGTTMPKPNVGMIFQETELQRTSMNAIVTGDLEMRVYANSESEAEQIVEEAKQAIDGHRNKPTRYGTLMDVRWPVVTREESEDKPGEWNLLATFGVQVCEPRGIRARAGV